MTGSRGRAPVGSRACEPGGADQVRSATCRRNAGEQLGICFELSDVLERQPRSA